MARTKQSAAAKPRGKTLPLRYSAKSLPVPRPIADRAPAVTNPPASPVEAFGVEDDVKFVFFYSNTTIFHSAVHEMAWYDTDQSTELRELLLSMKGPLLIDHLINEKSYHGVRYTGHERQMLLDLLCGLGIATNEEHFKPDIWQTYPARQTLTHNSGFVPIHQGTVCTIWLVETRRLALADIPTADDIHWVESYKAEQRQREEQTNQIFKAVSEASASSPEPSLPPALPSLPSEKRPLDASASFDDDDEDFAVINKIKRLKQTPAEESSAVEQPEEEVFSD